MTNERSAVMTSPETSVEERAELERLRQKAAELELALASAAGDPETHKPGGPPPARRRRWRTLVATVVIGLACFLAPLSVVAAWADNTVTDSDRYVETVTPLIDDPAIQNALADRITAEVFKYVDVRALTKEAFDALTAQGLPPRLTTQLQALIGPISNGVHSFTRTQVGIVVGSDAFAVAWMQANRVAHTELVKALTGQGSGTVNIADGVVSLNLAALVQVAKQQLTDAGFGLAERIPAVNAEFVIFRSEDLTRVQSGLRLLDVLGVWLPIFVLLMLLVGVYVAKRRRRAFIGAGLGLVGAMLALGIGLAIFRQVYLDSVPADVLPQDAAATLYDTLIRFMRSALRSTAVAALIIAAAAFLTGPSTTAVVTRRMLSRGIGSLRSSAESAGLRTGHVGGWVYAYRGPLRVGVVVLAGATLIIWDEPRISVILALTVATLILLAVIEFLARPPGPEPDGAASSDPLTGTAVGGELPPPQNTADESELSSTGARTDARG